MYLFVYLLNDDDRCINCVVGSTILEAVVTGSFVSTVLFGVFALI